MQKLAIEQIDWDEKCKSIIKEWKMVPGVRFFV